MRPERIKYKEKKKKKEIRKENTRISSSFP
jgi:hypothetical protein